VIAALREVVETLAPLERRAGSPGEREAAEWVAERLRRAGCPAEVEEERFLPGYAAELLPPGLAGVVSGLVALTGRARWPAAVLASLAAAAIADDVANGKRPWRRLVTRPRATWNAVGEIGDPSAERTLVLLAHHDAAPTGRVFDPSLQRWLARTFPDLVARVNTSMPLWWPVAGAPALVAMGAISGRRGLVAAGTALGVVSVASGAEIARSSVVPGANDNLSGVAALVGVAERLREQPVERLRVVLASCGAEEVLQGGIYGFAARHFPRLDPARTWMLNFDSVGSPALVMVEGEGTFRMEDYPDPAFRDLIAHVAQGAGIPLARGARARSSSDSVIPSRAGYPTAMLLSWEPDTKLVSNYHLPTDTPENLDYETVARAVGLGEAVARELAAV
jgi:hypothetical protein